MLTRREKFAICTSMKNALFFALAILSSVLLFCTNAEASKMSCSVKITHLKVSPINPDSELNTYTVNVSCLIQCAHHGSSYGINESLSKFYHPVCVNYSDMKGFQQAYNYGVMAVNSESLEKLRNECNGESSCGCISNGCSCPGCSPVPANTRESVELPENKSEGSISNPVRLQNINNVNGIKKFQKSYIEKNFKCDVIYADIYTMLNGCYINIIVTKNENGCEEYVYFDMTNAYNKLKNSREETKEKIKDMMALHLPINN